VRPLYSARALNQILSLNEMSELAEITEYMQDKIDAMNKLYDRLKEIDKFIKVMEAYMVLNDRQNKSIEEMIAKMEQHYKNVSNSEMEIRARMKNIEDRLRIPSL
jgi:septal ring factor EnvC (AmiA/AmiB activator)